MSMQTDLLPILQVDKIEVALNQARSYRFYYQMFLIRQVEQKLLDLYAQGYLFGTVHTSIGQEAGAVGVINALDLERDVVFSNHRAHGQYLVYSDDVFGLISEVMGKSSGVCQGVGGSQHLHYRNMYTNGIQGGIAPNAVGAALAEKMLGSGAVSVVFLGDGTMGQGAVYESFNMASLWSLPVVFVLEDNGIAQSTNKQFEHAGDLATRAASFDIESVVVDGTDAELVNQAAMQAVDIARNDQRPYFLVLDTVRLGPHSKGDDTRSKEELELLARRDPLRKMASYLGESARLNIEKSIHIRIEQETQQAMAALPLNSSELEARLGCPVA